MIIYHLKQLNLNLFDLICFLVFNMRSNSMVISGCGYIVMSSYRPPVILQVTTVNYYWLYLLQRIARLFMFNPASVLGYVRFRKLGGVFQDPGDFFDMRIYGVRRSITTVTEQRILPSKRQNLRRCRNFAAITLNNDTGTGPNQRLDSLLYRGSDPPGFFIPRINNLEGCTDVEESSLTFFSFFTVHQILKIDLVSLLNINFVVL